METGVADARAVLVGAALQSLTAVPIRRRNWHILTPTGLAIATRRRATAIQLRKAYGVAPISAAIHDFVIHIARDAAAAGAFIRKCIELAALPTKLSLYGAGVTEQKCR